MLLQHPEHLGPKESRKLTSNGLDLWCPFQQLVIIVISLSTCLQEEVLEEGVEVISRTVVQA